MEIKDANNNVILSETYDGDHPERYFVVADSSYRYQEIMGDNNIVLSFSLTYYIDFPVGCKINFQNTEYKMYELPTFTKVNERQYDYTLTFESPQKQLSRYKFRNHVDGRLNFTLTAKPYEFIEHIIRNLNMDERDSGWTIGECVESAEKTASFSQNYLLDALNQIAQLFETEWEIIGKTISLKKVEYNKNETQKNRLKYGKGEGFLSGISRQNSGENAVDVLWVEGGDRNIDQQTYVYDKSIEGQSQTLHANKLRLPRNEYCYYVPPTDPTKKGEVFLNSEVNQMAVDLGIGYADYVSTYLSNAVQFHTDADGFGIFRETYINNGYEDSLDLTEIYPHKVLKVASVELQGYTGDPATTKVDEITNRFWDIIATTDDDSAIPDYNDCLIGGQEVTIVFNTGMLAGKEFNLGEQSINGKVGCFDPATNKFLIQPQQIDGITMPDLPIKYDDGETYVQDKDGKSGTGYIPAVGDEFAVFHVSLPDQYIKEAEKELLLEGCHYLWQHSEVEVEFSGTVDPIWSVNKWDAISQYFVLGGYINFYDNDFCQNGRQLRILSIKTFLNNPHAPELTLSNSSVSQSISSELKKIPQNQVYTDYRVDNITSYARRSFRNAEETRDALQKWASETNNYFSNGISPITVQTMQLLVGDKSLQFEFGKATTDASDTVTAFDKQPWSPVWEDGKLKCPLKFSDSTDVIMRHRYYTTENGNEGVVKEFTDAEFPYWQFADNTQHEFTPAHPEYPYYLYIKAPKTAVTQHIGKVVDYATFDLVEINEKAELPTDTTTHYVLLAGILNSEQNGTRSYTNVYGTVEITGGQIRLDTAISIDGDRYIDFINGLIKGDVNIVDGGVTKNFIFGSDFYHNYGGITGENVFYGERIENFYGRAVRQWIGDESELHYEDSSLYLKYATIVFFADGSFLFKYANKNFFRDVRKEWATNVDGSMRISKNLDIGEKLWVGNYLEIGDDNADTTYFRPDSSHVVGDIRNRRDCASYTDRTINHYLGIVPTVLWHGFIWIENINGTSYKRAEVINRFRAQKSGGGYFDIRAEYSNKVVYLYLPDDVNREYLHFNAVKWHYWRSGQRQHGYYNFYEDDIYSINSVPSKGNNIMYVKYSWDGDDEEVPPFLLTIMYI